MVRLSKRRLHSLQACKQDGRTLQVNQLPYWIGGVAPLRGAGVVDNLSGFP